jgi:hypothetical protein
MSKSDHITISIHKIGATAASLRFISERMPDDGDGDRISCLLDLLSETLNNAFSVLDEHYNEFKRGDI